MRPFAGLALTTWGFCLWAGAVFTMLPANAAGPAKIWICLKDKGPASAALKPGSRAFEDLPVWPAYITALQNQGLTCDTRLKWQNLVSGRIDSSLIENLRALPFVQSISFFPRKAQALPLPRTALNWPPPGLGKKSAQGLDYGSGQALMESLHVDAVHAWMAGRGLKPGKGMRIAVIDADFSLGSPIFRDLFAQNRIRDQWDFVTNQSISVQEVLASGSHGAECLSLIGGNLPGTLVGVAPDADFLLYRSEEDAHEGFVEEDYVAAGIERAVDSGAQVISISLGYRYEYDDGNADLPFSSLDGRTRPSSIAATGAARRNVVVSVSMGNLPGASHIPVGPSLSAPADADSILSVGIGDAGRRKCYYSCTGPTADGRVKPEVSSLGLFAGCQVAVANTGDPSGTVNQYGGTSFAAPVVAGIAALLRQIQPELSAEQIRQSLIRSADRYAHPDSGLGYGVLDAWAAFTGIYGDTLANPASEKWIGLYHAGGPAPLFLRWELSKPMPNVQLLDLNGRRIDITVRPFGLVLVIEPLHDLRTGIYMARVR